MKDIFRPHLAVAGPGWLTDRMMTSGAGDRTAERKARAAPNSKQPVGAAWGLPAARTTANYSASQCRFRLTSRHKPHVRYRSVFPSRPPPRASAQSETRGSETAALTIAAELPEADSNTEMEVFI